MDKPISMSVKEYLMRVQSVRTNTPLKIIEAVVDFQFQEAHAALSNQYSVELSGFGKFLFNTKKAIKKYEKELSKKRVFENILKDITISDKKRKSTELKLQSTIETLALLKPKIDGIKLESNNGGVEKQSDSPQTDEGTDRQDISGENTDM